MDVSDNLGVQHHLTQEELDAIDAIFDNDSNESDGVVEDNDDNWAGSSSLPSTPTKKQKLGPSSYKTYSPSGSSSSSSFVVDLSRDEEFARELQAMENSQQSSSSSSCVIDLTQDEEYARKLQKELESASPGPSGNFVDLSKDEEFARELQKAGSPPPAVDLEVLKKDEELARLLQDDWNLALDTTPTTTSTKVKIPCTGSDEKGKGPDVFLDFTEDDAKLDKRLAEIEFQRRQAESRKILQEQQARLKAKALIPVKKDPGTFYNGVKSEPSSSSSFNRPHHPIVGTVRRLNTPSEASSYQVGSHLARSSIDNPSLSDIDFSQGYLGRFGGNHLNMADGLRGGYDHFGFSDAGGGPSTQMPEINLPNEAPLSEQEMQGELKNILENVNHTESVTEKSKRMKTPKGLLVELKPHQQLGLEWMLKMELGTSKGGILADEMGLGKTIQTISIMLQNPRKCPSEGPTLIVCPLSLMNQWREEIIDRTKKDSFRVYLYHGANREKSIKKLKQFDVIITSYGTLSSGCAMVKPDKKGKRKADDDDDDDEYIDEQKPKNGPLYGIEYYRVVLDEAHIIKNPQARSSRAVVWLKSKYRWCLTGTPIQNKIDDVFPLLRFLQIKPLGDETYFRKHISKNVAKNYRVGDALRKVQIAMKAVCFRRTKKDQLDGEYLIVLPEKDVQDVVIPFSTDERSVYDSMLKNARIQFNKYVKAGTVMKNYSSILALLLRLRQICCHPGLVTERSRQIADALDDQKENKIEIIQNMARDIIERLKREMKDDDECGMCLDAPQQPQIFVNCGHCFCSECIDGLFSKGTHSCPICRKPIDKKSVAPLNTFFKEFCPDKYDEQEESKDNAEMALLQKQTWVTSAKTDKLLEILKESRDQSPNDKIIVFSQFVQYIRLIEGPLKNAGFKFVTYTGDMSPSQRVSSVEALKKDPSVHVILVSLKCGSLGLNLTCANVVVLLDLWWNPAVEFQAIDRVHRFGQEKKVKVHRLVIENSIEERIIKLQEDKQELANDVLDDSAGGKNFRPGRSRLNVRQMMSLFSD